jgi:hypothetical protein
MPLRGTTGQVRRQSSKAGRWLSRNLVAVEKLTWEKSAEKTSRQDALQTIFSARLDILYPKISPDF